MGSPTFQTAKRDAVQCYTTNPNNPLVGLDSLFGGMHHGGKGKRHHGMGGKMGGDANGNRNMNGNANSNEESKEDDSAEIGMEYEFTDLQPNSVTVYYAFNYILAKCQLTANLPIG